MSYNNCQCDICKSDRFMNELKMHKKEINTMQETTKEEAEAKLLQLNVPRDIGGHYFILDVLEALGVIKFKPEPDLSPVQKALCAVMTEVEVRMGPDYGKLTPGYPSEYGAGCLIDGLKNKGYRIVTNDSRVKFKYAMLKHGYSEGSRGLQEVLAAYDSTFS